MGEESRARSRTTKDKNRTMLIKLERLILKWEKACISLTNFIVHRSKGVMDIQ